MSLLPLEGMGNLEQNSETILLHMPWNEVLSIINDLIYFLFNIKSFKWNYNTHSNYIFTLFIKNLTWSELIELDELGHYFIHWSEKLKEYYS